MTPDYESMKRRYQHTATDSELLTRFARIIHDHVSYHDLVMDGCPEDRAREVLATAAKIAKEDSK